MDIETIGHELTELVQQTADAARCPEIVWGVTVDGALRIDGHAAAATAPPLDAEPAGRHRDRVFRIASMTKSFTAAAVLSLRDEGALRLDDPIAALAPELATIVHPAPDAPPITVRHLLSMTSGMASDDVWADRHLDVSDDELSALYARGATFAVMPATAFEYSNLGYSMLGRIIGHLTGRRPQQVITQRILEPLDLGHTGWVLPGHDHWARPFRSLDDAIAAEADPLGDGAIAPMGGLWSTLDDLAAWTTWLGDAWPTSGSRTAAPSDAVISPSTRREMQQANVTRRIEARPDGPNGPVHTAGGYGYGLFVDDDARHGRVVHHTGGLPGYGSNMRWLPDRRVAVIALANTTYAPMQPLTLRMLDRMAELDALPPAYGADPALLTAAAEGLVALLGRWDDEAAGRLFTDNVGLDDSFERRAAEGWRLAADHPRLRLLRVRAETATGGIAVVEGDDGAVIEIEIELSPTVPPLVQKYVIRT